MPHQKSDFFATNTQTNKTVFGLRLNNHQKDIREQTNSKLTNSSDYAAITLTDM